MNTQTQVTNNETVMFATREEMALLGWLDTDKEKGVYKKGRIEKREGVDHFFAGLHFQFCGVGENLRCKMVVALYDNISKAPKERTFDVYFEGYVNNMEDVKKALSMVEPCIITIS